ncbi:MAG TPA: hypothetical protein VK253_05705 [Candidatus Binatia bacterium]|nr:hypothetical protein [Candidatus Binatia bacterium]
MGKTVPAYRWALEDEIATWKGFRKSLPKDEDREAFDQLMDMCRNYASAGGNATNPIIFEPMVMSIMLAQQEKISKLEYKLQDLIWQKTEEKQVGSGY